MSIRLKLYCSIAGYLLVCWHCLQHDFGASEASARASGPGGTARQEALALQTPELSGSPVVTPVVVAGAPVTPVQLAPAVAQVSARAPVPVVDAGVPDTISGMQRSLDQIMAEHTIVFAPSSDVLDPRSYPVLDEVAAVLRRVPNSRVEVQGHTDNVGNAMGNQDMSARRAAAVARYLSNAGVSLRRMRVMGFGSDRPIADNATPEGRQRNRRISFRLLGVL